MTRGLGWAIGVLLLFLCGLASADLLMTTINTVKPSAAERWEHRFVVLSNTAEGMTSELTQLGALGWRAIHSDGCTPEKPPPATGTTRSF